jgi:hypothetical protein
LTLTVDGEQLGLAGAAAVKPLILAHWRLYSDHAAKVVSQEYHFTKTYPARYKWDGSTEETFDDRILEVGAIVRAMQHVPNGDLSDATAGNVSLRLSNLRPGRSAFWNALDLDALAYSEITIATLLLPADRFRPGAETPWDLTDLPGTDHLVRFRGELVSVGDVSELEIPLEFAPVEPNLDWPVATDASEVDPKDLGKRYPIPVGAAKDVPCINRNVGWVTTISEEISAAFTGEFEVGDPTGFPSTGNFEIQIGSERLQVTRAGASADHVQVVTRGYQSSTAVPHKAAEVAIEIIAVSTILFSGVEAAALDRLYVISPITGDKTAVTTAYTTTLASSATDPGRTVSVVTISSTQMRALLDSMIAAAAVTQQPEFEVDDLDLVDAEATTREIRTVSPPGYGTDAVLSPTESIIRAASLGTYEQLTYSWPSGSGLDASRTVKRWRCKMKYGRQSGDSSGDDDIFCRVEPQGSIPGMTNGSDEIDDNVTGHDNAAYGDQAVGLWRTPAAGTKLSDLEGGTKKLDVSLIRDADGGGWTGSSHWLYPEWVGIQAEMNASSTTRTTDVAIVAASLGFGLQFIADVTGPAAALSAQVYDFDTDSGWSVSAGASRSTETADPFEGTGAQKITATSSPTTIHSCDATTEWSSSDGTLSLETAIQVEGTGAVRSDSDFVGGDSSVFLQWDKASGSVDLSNGFQVHVFGAADDAPAPQFEIVFYDTAGKSLWYRYTSPTDDVPAAEWLELSIDLSSSDHEVSRTGGFDSSIIDTIQIGWDPSGATTDDATVSYIVVDDMRQLPSGAFDARIAQRNDLSSVDMTADADRYLLAAKGLGSGVDLTVWLSSDVASGTTKPTNVWEIPFTLRRAGVWDAPLPSGTITKTGSVTITAIKSLALVATLAHGVRPSTSSSSSELGAIFDDLRAVGSGTSLSMPDILEWLLVYLARLGWVAIDASSFSTARTNLGSNVHAGTLNLAGDSFPAVLARLGFEGRCNVAAREESSRTVYRCLAALSTYKWPTSSDTFEELRDPLLSVRAAPEHATRFLFRYGLSLAPGAGQIREDDFSSVVQVDRTTQPGAAPASDAIYLTERELGRRDAEPLYLYFTQDAPTANYIAGYYASEGIRRARRLGGSVPWSDAYALELGDVRSLAPMGAAASTHWRTIGVSIALDDARVGVNLEEVET